MELGTAGNDYDNHKQKYAPKLSSFHNKLHEHLSTMQQIAIQIPQRTKSYRMHMFVFGTFLFLSHRAHKQNHPYYNKTTTHMQSQMQLHLLKHEEYTKKYPDRREHPLLVQHKEEVSNPSVPMNHKLPDFMDPYRGDETNNGASLHPLLVPDLSERDALLHLFPNPTIPIPPILDESMATLHEPFTEGDIPVFFHIPRSGGTTIKKIMEVCLNMKLMDASPTTSTMDLMTRDDAQMNQTSSDTSKEPYMDIISIQDPYLLQTLFQTSTTKDDTPPHEDTNDQHQHQHQHYRGRVFVMFRHPMDRILSSFYYYGKAHWEPNFDPELAHISLELYAKQNRTEHNYLVRTLTNIPPSDPLTREHLTTAKEILRTKCLIGLLSEKEHSMRRFENYFHWDYSMDRTKQCHERLLHWDFFRKNPHPMIQEGSDQWNRIVAKNELDMELYDYVKQLFHDQANLFHYHDEGHVIGRKGHF